jgi:hypothetical protein
LFLYLAVANIFITYLSWPTTVKLTTVLETPTNFPAVTICNLNNINWAIIDSYLRPDGVLRGNLTKTNTSDAIKEVKVSQEEIRSRVIANTNLTDYDKLQYGYTIETLLLSCYYNGESCGASDFDWFYTFEYGNCFIFNGNRLNTSREIKKTSKTGMNNGLRIEVFVGKPGVQDEFTISNGAYVAVHNNSRLPIIASEGITVATGKATNIGVRRTFYYKLASPYSDCRKNSSVPESSDSQYFNQTLTVNEYSQKICYEICFDTEKVQPNCSCTDPKVVYKPSGISVCSTSTELNCVENQREAMIVQSYGDLCDKYCPRECDSIDYTTSISLADYPTDSYSAIIQTQSSLATKFNPSSTVPNKARSVLGVARASPGPGPSPSPSPGPSQNAQCTSCDLVTSVALVNVYIDEITYTKIEEEATITTDTLLGLIGNSFINL